MPAPNAIQQLLGESVRIPGATLRKTRAGITVEFDSRRTQRVTCEQTDTHVIVESIAVPRIHDWIKQKQLNVFMLRANHAIQSVGLRRKGDALTVFAKLLRGTLDRDEAVDAVVSVAREADRLEYMLTNRDEV